MLKEKRIVFIGSGNMSEALIAGLLRTDRARPEQLVATDILVARRDLLTSRFGITTSDDNRSAGAQADVIVLSVEPQGLDEVLEEIGPTIGSDTIIVSVAAGYPIARIAQRVDITGRIVRAMPNTPSIIGEGITALAYADQLTPGDQAAIRELFESVGKVVVIEERLMNAVTGLSGSGPAYVYMMIEALADGGVMMGLPRETAAALAAQTVAGAARMVISHQAHPAALKDRVASPGGTTIAGLRALEKGKVRATLMSAVEAATKRSHELGRESTSSGENESCNTG